MLPNKYNFSDCVALVTGSSNGIGAAIAIALSSNGCKVVITGRSTTALEKVAQEVVEASGGITTPLQIVGDLLDEAFPARLITETIANFGRLDFLVNNAGSMMGRVPLSDAKLLPEFDKLVSLNARCVVNLIQLSVPHLKLTKGAILNIGSIASEQPWSGILPYCVSKSMLNTISKCAALELAQFSIRVNIINPGAVDTDIYRSMDISLQDWTQFMQRKEQTSLLKLVAQPDDIAHLACFLLSQDAKNVTGSIFTSDTGASLK